MRRRKKRGNRTALSLALLFVAVVCFLGVFAVRPKEPPILAYVNGEPIYTAEFQLFMTHDRAEAAAYFYEKYGAVDGPDFWNSTYDGSTPLEYLKELALRDAVEVKVMQCCAKLEGITENIDYVSIQKQWERENRQRAQKSKDGQILFGPAQFSLPEFYAYQNSSWETMLYKKYVQEHSIAGEIMNGSEQRYSAFQESLKQEARDAQLEIRQEQWRRLSL